MSQLALFEGSHVPRTAARQALERGELGEALARLGRVDAEDEAADAARLEQIASALHETDEDPAALHGAFAAALGAGQRRGFLSDTEWFGLYARRVARALDAEPERRFRGWLGAHFAFAAADVETSWRAVSRIVASVRPGAEWIEAARLAFQLGDAAIAARWVHAACLDSPVALASQPPPLEPCGISALDAAPELPVLPAPVEDLFETARSLGDVPGPPTRWVAAIGEIDRVLPPPDPLEAAPSEPSSESSESEDPVRAFLTALRAARRSRERDGSRPAGRCSDRELRARRHMQRLAPALLERYLRTLSGSML